MIPSGIRKSVLLKLFLGHNLQWVVKSVTSLAIYMVLSLLSSLVSAFYFFVTCMTTLKQLLSLWKSRVDDCSFGVCLGACILLVLELHVFLLIR